MFLKSGIASETSITSIKFLRVSAFKSFISTFEKPSLQKDCLTLIGDTSIIEIKQLEGDETNPIHLLWMLDQIQNNVEQSITKKHRWLGYIQGVMTVKSYITVLEEREFTRSILNGA